MNTPQFRAGYAYVFTPAENKQEDGSIKKEYSVTAIFPKGTDLSALKAAAAAALARKFGADETKWPANLRSPFRKCSEKWKFVDGKQVVPAGFEDGEATFLTLKSKQRPGVVDGNMQDIIEPHQFYSGCYAIASVGPYAYDNKGNRGVSFGLNNLQKQKDGDPLGGRSAPSSDFQPVAAPAGASTGAASLFD